MIEGAHGICDELPDGNTSKPYPLDHVYENIEATSTPRGMPETSTLGGMPTTSTTGSMSTTSANRPTSQATRQNKIWNTMIFFPLSICSVCIWR